MSQDLPGVEMARERMLESHLRARDIDDARVLAAMARVPRERFVEPGAESHAYVDAPLPIGEGQTISQPYIVALMAQAAAIGAADRVLEIGTGSGYGAAVLGELAARVDTVERHASLATTAARRLADLGYQQVHVHVGDGSCGWPESSPFDAIVVTAGAPGVPQALREQLAVGGRLVIPVGNADGGQRLCRFTRRLPGDMVCEDLGGVIFVPLVGEQGWPPESRADSD
ncbi:MAG TPA: protein-L-isoaspartate(D-aspartate) O-methyltransferase [Stenotrophomonas sp.]|jgi:protein-L-isoaspartate(D-aspartate) O-methyltransferase